MPFLRMIVSRNTDARDTLFRKKSIYATSRRTRFFKQTLRQPQSPPHKTAKMGTYMRKSTSLVEC